MSDKTALSELRHIALIAIGGNQSGPWGNVTSIVQKAASRVAAMSAGRAAISRFYATPAFPAGSGPDYVNAAVAITTDRTPYDLLRALHAIEIEAGRMRVTRWGARTLDLDLLAVEDLVLPDLAHFDNWRKLDAQSQQTRVPDRLILPHPRLQDRAFVLVPLCDVAPDWRHPVLGLTARDLCAALPPAERAAVFPLPDADTPARP